MNSVKVNRRTNTCYIDWKDAEATLQLTRALLATRFGLDLQLPRDRLCPALTSRVNYIHFIKALLGKIDDKTCSDDKVIWGIDIGTGASCIYPLLGAKMHGWHFVATEVDPVSVECAKRNVSINGLDELIEVRSRTPEESSSVVEHVARERVFHFTMCNPPFFVSSKAVRKVEHMSVMHDGNPMRACMATTLEACTDGGETEFVKRMVDESTRIPLQCHWWTSLLGCKKSLRVVWDYLHGGCKSMPIGLDLTVEEGELVQGKTTRWVIAWSFFSAAEKGPDSLVVKKPDSKRRRINDGDDDD